MWSPARVCPMPSLVGVKSAYWYVSIGSADDIRVTVFARLLEEVEPYPNEALY